jgi:uncharacterized membrane protein YtjA (UPF0391 family)
MLSYATLFLLAAIVAGVFGFVIDVGVAAYVAKLLFCVLLTLYVLSVLNTEKPSA